MPNGGDSREDDRNAKCNVILVQKPDSGPHGFDIAQRGVEVISCMGGVQAARGVARQPYLPPLADRLAETTVSNGGDVG